MSISAKDYITWVQRAMNRMEDAGLTCDGVITPQYRDAVTEFQADHGLSQNGDIGPKEQDKIIRVSNGFYEYVEWVQDALSSPRVGISIPVNGARDNTTKNAIKSFQAFHDLRDDGWVGPRTETVLFKVSGVVPEWHIKGVGPKPTPKPKPKPKPRPTPAIPVDSRVTQIINHAYHHAMFNRDAYSADQRLMIIKVCGKLRMRHGINDTFIHDGKFFNYWQGNKQSKTIKPVQDDAREFIARGFKAMHPSSQTSKVAWRGIIKNLIKHIEHGIRFVSWHRDGKFTKSKNPSFEPMLEMAHEFLQDKKTKSNSIIHCFKGSRYL